MRDPKISIIVPVYNVERYIRQCILSVTNQSFEEWELILVDDGSLDSSGVICEEYAKVDSRIRVLHKPNGGVSSARNAGLNIARGEIITFIDSDDWVEPIYCATIVNNISEADILIYSEVWHYVDGSIVTYSSGACERHGNMEVQREIFHIQKNKMKYEGFGYLWNKAFRRNIIRDNYVRFNEGLSIGEDEVFCLAYALHVKSLKTINVPLYHYEFREVGLASVKNKSVVWFALVKAIGQYARKMECNELRFFYLKEKLSKRIESAIFSDRNNLKRLREMRTAMMVCRQEEVMFPTKRVIKRFVKGVGKKLYGLIPCFHFRKEEYN